MNRFGITAEGCYLPEMESEEEPMMKMWTAAEHGTPWHMYVCGNLTPMLLRFALWMACGGCLWLYIHSHTGFQPMRSGAAHAAVDDVCREEE